MLQDIRIAVRGYLAKPLFTIVVLSILGLAIGANSAIFTVVNAVLLRPLDYPDGSALVSVAPTLIVGVMPPAFDFPAAGTEIWVPLRLSRTQPPNPAIPPARYRQYRILSVVARLKPETTLQQARVEMSSIAARLETAYPEA